MNHKLKSRVLGEYADDILVTEKITKKPLDEGEEGEWKSWLKTQHSKNWGHGIWSHHFTVIRRRKIETVTDFIFLGSQITLDGDSSHEFKRCLLLGRKAMTNQNSVLKKRDTALLTQVCIVKAVIFLVVMYWCESWTLKKAEQWRVDTFEFWCWRRLLRVPWRERKSKQSILKEINREYSLEGLMLKLKFQYFGYLMQRADSLEKPYAGKDWG